MESHRWSAAAAIAALSLLMASAVFAGPLRPRPAIIKPDRSVLLEHHRRDVIQVKFLDDLPIRERNGQLVDFGGNVLAEAAPAMGLVQGGRWQRLAPIPEARLDELRLRAQENLQREIADLNVEFFLFLPDDIDTADAIDTFNASAIVQLAQPVSRPLQLPGPPDFQPNQGYLNASPTGIDAYFGWDTLGTRGAGVRIVDLEYSFNANHLDLPSVTILGGPPQNPFSDDYHGTAVLGQLGAIDNGWGVTGIAPDSELFFAGTYINFIWNIAGAILTSVDAFDPGDIILIEQQQAGPNGGANYVPVEWHIAEYNAILIAVGNGIVVVQAAGNGDENLDDPIYSTGNNGHWPFLPENDSGAIIVGAGAAPAAFGGSTTARSRLSFSNYGSRVDLQGWGERVWTAGYGWAYFQQGPNLYFTDNFGGTSSASPIVAGACALLQAAHIERYNVPLPPLLLRDMLKQTGATQQSGLHPASQNIGPLPDVPAAAALFGMGLPENVLCENATTVVTGETVEFSTLTAPTNGPDEPEGCLFFGDSHVQHDIWYDYTATCTGELTISLCQSSYNTKLAVYGGCPAGSGEVIACNVAACGLRSEIVMPVAQGEHFIIRIGGHDGAQGHGVMTVICAQQPMVPGDLNNDGLVDVSDLLILLGAWGACPNGDCPADLNDDGVVNVSDLLVLLANWG